MMIGCVYADCNATGFGQDSDWIWTRHYIFYGSYVHRRNCTKAPAGDPWSYEPGFSFSFLKIPLGVLCQYY